jgi:hypothetical protein
MLTLKLLAEQPEGDWCARAVLPPINKAVAKHIPDIGRVNWEYPFFLLIRRLTFLFVLFFPWGGLLIPAVTSPRPIPHGDKSR